VKLLVDEIFTFEMPCRIELKHETKPVTALANQTELCINETPSPENQRSQLVGDAQPSEPESNRNSSWANVRGSVDVSTDIASKVRKLSVQNPSHSNSELEATLGKLKTLIDETSMLSIEHQFIDQTMSHLASNSIWQSIEAKELFLLNVCERYLKQTTAHLQDARKDKSTPLIEILELQNERACNSIRQKSNQRCPRKWNEIGLSSQMQDEEIRTLKLQLERIVGFKQALQASHDDFIAENQLYLEFLEKYTRKTDEEISSMTSDDINRAQIIAQTLLADCQSKIFGDLSEIKESNFFLQSHLNEFEKIAAVKSETLGTLDQLKLKLASSTASSNWPLADELSELNDQIAEIHNIESKYSLKETEVKKIFSHLDEKTNRESTRFPALQKEPAYNLNPSIDNTSIDTLATLYKLYDMRDHAEQDLKCELAALIKEESELFGVARIFDDLTMVPANAQSLNSQHPSIKQPDNGHQINELRKFAMSK